MSTMSTESDETPRVQQLLEAAKAKLRGELPLLPGVHASASFSPDKTYRYLLRRHWFPKQGKGDVLWIMLNPSITGEDVDDRTIRKCQKFARSWGYDGILVGHLYALRATSPDDLYAVADPVGEANDDVLAGLFAAPGVGLVVAAWGTGERFYQRDRDVIALAERAGRDLHALRLTNAGKPWHPLYVKDDAKPFLYWPAPSPSEASDG